MNAIARSPLSEAMGSAQPVHSSGITAQHLLTRIREKCEQDFKYFARYFFKVRKGVKFVFSDHHDLICDDLMAIYRGEITNYILNMPPRYSKTELVIVLFSAWCFMKNPRSEFIHLSYAESLVLDNSDGIREIIRSAEFRQLWPDIVIRDNKKAKGAWSTIQGGQFFAKAAGGTVTGFGAGRMDEWDGEEFQFSGALMIDDPLKPDDARHDTIREGVNRRWDETMKSRRNSPKTPVIVVMQRIHEKDFTAMLLADSEFTWKHRCLEALIDEGQPTERALWPAKHTVDELKAMRDKRNERGEVNPVAKATYNSQYQQAPSSIDGNLLKVEWWRWYASLEEVTQRCTMFFFTADTAYTGDTANDPTSLMLWGAEGGKRLYLLGRVSGHWEFPQLLTESKKFWESKEGATKFYVEAKASGLSLIQSLRKQGINAAKWAPKNYGYPDDKVGRVKESSWSIFNGDIWLPDPEIAPWIDSVVNQCSAFTTNDSHANDDDVDCITMAVSVWTHYGGGTKRVETQEKKPVGTQAA
jgi:predicted phage terminase large subunit-like protein